MKNILISGMGGDMAQSIAKIIKKEFPDSKIYGIDISTRNAAPLFCHEFTLGLKATDPNYLSFIKNFINDHHIDFFIPCTEHELRSIATLPSNDSLWKKLVSCDSFILNTCLDKFETFNYLKKNNISVPWFSNSAAQLDNHFPCIYKKRSSSGSRDIFKVSTNEEALFLEKYSPNGLFQEFLPGDDQELTCSIFRWDDGTFQCIQLLRTLTGGATSWAKVVKNEEVYSLCQKIGTLFNLKGSLNIQLRLTPKGPMIFEINPRFSSTVYMRHLIGFQDVVWSLKKMSGEHFIIDSKITTDIEITKIFDVAILK